MGIPMLKIRWFRDRHIFNMGIPIPGKTSLYWDRPQEAWTNSVWKTSLSVQFRVSENINNYEGGILFSRKLSKVFSTRLTYT